MSNKITILLKAETVEATKNINKFKTDVKLATGTIENLHNESTKLYNRQKDELATYTTAVKTHETELKRIREQKATDIEDHTKKLAELEGQGVYSGSKKAMLKDRDILDAKIQTKQEEIANLESFNKKEDELIKDGTTERSKQYKKNQDNLKDHNEKVKEITLQRDTVQRSIEHAKSSADLKRIEQVAKADIAEETRKLKSTENLYKKSQTQLARDKKTNYDSITEAKNTLQQRKDLLQENVNIVETNNKKIIENIIESDEKIRKQKIDSAYSSVADQVNAEIKGNKKLEQIKKTTQDEKNLLENANKENKEAWNKHSADLHTDRKAHSTKVAKFNALMANQRIAEENDKNNKLEKIKKDNIKSLEKIEQDSHGASDDKINKDRENKRLAYQEASLANRKAHSKKITDFNMQMASQRTKEFEDSFSEATRHNDGLIKAENKLNKDYELKATDRASFIKSNGQKINSVLDGLNNQKTTIHASEITRSKESLDNLKAYSKLEKESNEKRFNDRQDFDNAWIKSQAKIQKIREEESKIIDTGTSKADENRLKSLENEIIKKKELSKANTVANEKRKKLDDTIRESLNTQKKEAIEGEKWHRQTYVNTKATNAYEDAKDKLDDQLKRNIISQSQYNIALSKEKSNLNKATLASDNHAKSTESLANQTIRYMRWMGTLAGAYYAVSASMRVTVGLGIEVNKMMEDNTFGIAALTSANTRMIDSMGTLLTPVDKFIIGQKMAKETMAQLRVESLKTPATFGQLTEIYQQATGQTLAMGDAFGTAVKSINKNTVELSQRFSNIAGAIGQPMDRVKEEIRSALTGNVSTDSIISTMIFGSPTEANKAIKEAKKRTNGLKELFDLKFKPFDILGETRSYQKGFLAMQNAWEMSMADMVEKSGMFADITDAFYEISQSLAENSDEMVSDFNSIYDSAKDVVGVLDNILVPAIAARTVYGLATAFGVLTAATHANTLAALKNPYVLAAVATAGAGYTIYEYFSDEADRLDEVAKLIESKTESINSMQTSKIVESREAISKQLREENKKINQLRIDMGEYTLFEKLSFEPENEDTVAYEKQLKVIKELTEAYNKYKDIENKQTDTKKQLEEQSTLLTKIALNKKVIDDVNKFTAKDEDELVTLAESRVEWSEALLVVQKKLGLKINEDAKSQKILKDAEKTIQEGIESSKNKTASITADRQAKELKASQEYQTALANISGVEVKLSDQKLNQIASAEKIRENAEKNFKEAVGAKNISEAQVKLDEAKKKELVLQFEYQGAITKEQEKQLKNDKDRIKNVNDLFATINKQTKQQQDMYDMFYDITIPDSVKMLDEANEKMISLYNSGLFTAKQLEEVADILYKDDEVSLFDSWGEMASSQITSGIHEGIQDGLSGDFDLSKLVGSITGGIGDAFTTASLSAIASQAGTAQGIQSGSMWGLAGGVALMGVSSLMGRDEDEYKKQIEAIDNQTDKIVGSLDAQTSLLEKLGNTSAATQSDFQSTVASFEGEIAKFAVLTKKTTEKWHGIEISSAEYNRTFDTSTIQAFTEQFDEVMRYVDAGYKADFTEFNIQLDNVSVGILDTVDTFKTLSKTLTDVYDGLNDNILAEKKLADARETLENLTVTRYRMSRTGAIAYEDKVLGEDFTEEQFSRFISTAITNIDNLSTSVGALADDLESPDTKTHLQAVADLEKATGLMFEGNVKAAQDTIEYIELYGGALAESKANIAEWEQRNETASEKVARLTEEMKDNGYVMNSYSDALEEASDGGKRLTDRELELLQAREEAAEITKAETKAKGDKILADREAFELLQDSLSTTIYDTFATDTEKLNDAMSVLSLTTETMPKNIEKLSDHIVGLDKSYIDTADESSEFVSAINTVKDTFKEVAVEIDGLSVKGLSLVDFFDSVGKIYGKEFKLETAMFQLKEITEDFGAYSSKQTIVDINAGAEITADKLEMLYFAFEATNGSINDLEQTVLSAGLASLQTAEDLKKASLQASKDLKDANEEKRKSLQQELDMLTEVTTQRDIDLALLSEENKSILEEIHLQQDANKLAETNKTLQDELNGLTLTTAQLRKKEISDMDASTTSIKESIWAFQDLTEAQGIIADDIVNTWKDASDEILSLSNTFSSLSNSIGDTISELLGGSDALDSQDTLIKDFWNKQGELDKLLSKDSFTSIDETRIKSLVDSITGLSPLIQGAALGDNTQITSEMVSVLDKINKDVLTAQSGLSIQDTIGELNQTTIDYLGADSEIVSWLKTLNGTVGELSFSDYTLQQTTVGAYDIIDGSHAMGLANVPYDGYIAELHKDERVLTREENKIYTPQNNIYPSIDMLKQYGNNTSDPEIKKLLKNISEKLDKLDIISKATKHTDATLTAVSKSGNKLRVEIA